jgi:hypothetical protein
MPYRLVHCPKGFFVENQMTGKRYSRYPMSEQMARNQLRILRTAEPTRSYVHGGIITSDTCGRPPNMTTFTVPTDGVDHVPILAQEGELMIPKRYVSTVQRFLHSKKIYLPK